MGLSIYYEAKRGYPLTDEEKGQIKSIAEKFDREKKFKKGEDFHIYDYDVEEPEIIFSGATGLPMVLLNPMITVQACLYWADCLTEIRRAVKDAEWSAQMDESELIWDEKAGWKLPAE